MTDQRINVQTSFNTDFCWTLEYHLTEALINSAKDKWELLWCDGIDEPTINEQFTSRNITSIKQITTKAWIGTDGNGRYDMIIKLGRCARRKALRGLNLETCLPDAESLDWVEIDLDNLWIEIRLN